MRTPLHEAISQKHLNICPILVAAGADLSVANNLGKTPRELGIDCGLTLEQVERCLGMLNYVLNYFRFILTLFC